MNVLLTKLSNEKLRDSKTGQHREGILLQGEITAGQGDTAKVEVGTAGTIVTMRMAAYYTTLDNIGTVAVPDVEDDGICHLRGMLWDTDKNLILFNDFVPFNLFSSPGRIKAKSAFVPGSPNFLLGVRDPCVHSCGSYRFPPGAAASAVALAFK